MASEGADLFLFPEFFTIAPLEFVFLFLGAPDDELPVFVLRGRCLREGAFALVVFGRELRNAPRTSSSGSCALTTNRPKASATTANNMMKIFDLILKFLR